MTDTDRRKFKVEFKNLLVEIIGNTTETFRLTEMLFCDLPSVSEGGPKKQVKRYDVLANSDSTEHSLFEGNRIIYRGRSRYQLAYELVNEVLYHCIDGNKHQHALHAGAVWNGDYGIIIPGISGTGKSTFTALLCLNGWKYLTDELVFLSNEGRITPFTRPINLKTRMPIVSESFEDKYRDQLILSENGGAIVPHRLLNKVFSSAQPKATHIIFPKYQEGAETEFLPISPAQSCFRLIQCHVNARNLPAHGISSLSSIARTCQSYSLIYSNFSEVKDLLQSTLTCSSSPVQ